MPRRTFFILLRSPVLLAVALVLLAAVPPVFADLRSSTLESLLLDSEWIVLAQVDAREEAAHGAGVARMRPLETWRGETSHQPFALRWTDEVHDQRVPSPPAVVLLFLKRRAGEWTAAQYGRSLWPISTRPAAGTACSRWTPYRYPVDLVQLDDTQRARLLRHAGRPPRPIVCLDDPSALSTPVPKRSPR